MTETYSRGMSTAADELGLEYRYSAIQTTVWKDPPWDGFRPGGPFLYNIMHGTWHGCRVRVFDFEPTSNEHATDLRTAICVSSDAIAWPPITVRPYGTLDRVANMFFEEVPLREDSQTRPRFVVDSTNADDADWPGLIDPRLDDFLRENDDLVIHLGPGKLAFYREHRALEADQVELFLEKGRELLQIVSAPPVEKKSNDTAPDAGQFLVRSQRSRLQRLGEMVLVLLILLFCGFHVWQANQQRKAAQFASTQGWITRAEFDDVDDADPRGGLQLGAIEYEYLVDGHRHQGGAANRRFLWRPIRKGDETARQLKQQWLTGGRPTVFYDPQRPYISVLDNTFTKGDTNFVKLLLGVSGLCVVGLTWPLTKRLGSPIRVFLLRHAKPFHDGRRISFPLPAAPFALDTLAFAIIPLALLSLIWVLTLAMEPGFWLAKADFWIKWFFVLNLAAVPVIYVFERLWRGGDNRLVADPIERHLLVPQTAGRLPLELAFDRIRSIRLRNTATDFQTLSTMPGYDPMLTYVDEFGRPQEVMITRFFSREVANRLIQWVHSFVDFRKRPEAGCAKGATTA